MGHLTVSLAPELASIVRPGVIWWTGATVVLHEHALDPLLAEAEAKVRISPPAESAAVRTMYKKVGIDPTKTRPSNEALLRRVRKGDAIPRINSAVDIVNWCSLEFQLPYGLYDASKIEGAVTMRLGREGEKYAGIRKDEVNVGGRITGCRRSRTIRQPHLRFRPHDGDAETTELLVVIYAPTEIPSRSSSESSPRPRNDSSRSAVVGKPHSRHIVPGLAGDPPSLSADPPPEARLCRWCGNCLSVAVSLWRLCVLEPSIEKVRRRFVAADPVLMSQEVVHFVGQHELLDFDLPFPQLDDQVDRLDERHVAVVVSMDQQHRRLPGVDGGERRRAEGAAREVGVVVNAVIGHERADALVPVVHAVEVHAGGEQVRRA